MPERLRQTTSHHEADEDGNTSPAAPPPDSDSTPSWKRGNSTHILSSQVRSSRLKPASNLSHEGATWDAASILLSAPNLKKRVGGGTIATVAAATAAATHSKSQPHLATSEHVSSAPRPVWGAVSGPEFNAATGYSHHQQNAMQQHFGDQYYLKTGGTAAGSDTYLAYAGALGLDHAFSYQQPTYGNTMPVLSPAPVGGAHAFVPSQPPSGLQISGNNRRYGKTPAQQQSSYRNSMEISNNARTEMNNLHRQKRLDRFPIGDHTEDFRTSSNTRLGQSSVDMSTEITSHDTNGFYPYDGRLNTHLWNPGPPFCRSDNQIFPSVLNATAPSFCLNTCDPGVSYNSTSNPALFGDLTDNLESSGSKNASPGVPAPPGYSLLEKRFRSRKIASLDNLPRRQNASANNFPAFEPAGTHSFPRADGREHSNDEGASSMSTGKRNSLLQSSTTGTNEFHMRVLERLLAVASPTQMPLTSSKDSCTPISSNRAKRRDWSAVGSLGAAVFVPAAARTRSVDAAAYRHSGPRQSAGEDSTGRSVLPASGIASNHVVSPRVRMNFDPSRLQTEMQFNKLDSCRTGGGFPIKHAKSPVDMPYNMPSFYNSGDVFQRSLPRVGGDRHIPLEKSLDENGNDAEQYGGRWDPNVLSFEPQHLRHDAIADPSLTHSNPVPFRWSVPERRRNEDSRVDQSTTSKVDNGAEATTAAYCENRPTTKEIPAPSPGYIGDAKSSDATSRLTFNKNVVPWVRLRAALIFRPEIARWVGPHLLLGGRCGTAAFIRNLGAAANVSSDPRGTVPLVYVDPIFVFEKYFHENQVKSDVGSPIVVAPGATHKDRSSDVSLGTARWIELGTAKEILFGVTELGVLIARFQDESFKGCSQRTSLVTLPIVTNDGISPAVPDAATKDKITVASCVSPDLLNIVIGTANGWLHSVALRESKIVASINVKGMAKNFDIGGFTNVTGGNRRVPLDYCGAWRQAGSSGMSGAVANSFSSIAFGTSRGYIVLLAAQSCGDPEKQPHRLGTPPKLIPIFNDGGCILCLTMSDTDLVILGAPSEKYQSQRVPNQEGPPLDSTKNSKHSELDTATPLDDGDSSDAKKQNDNELSSIATSLKKTLQGLKNQLSQDQQTTGIFGQAIAVLDLRKLRLLEADMRVSRISSLDGTQGASDVWKSRDARRRSGSRNGWRRPILNRVATAGKLSRAEADDGRMSDDLVVAALTVFTAMSIPNSEDFDEYRKDGVLRSMRTRQSLIVPIRKMSITQLVTHPQLQHHVIALMADGSAKTLRISLHDAPSVAMPYVAKFDPSIRSAPQLEKAQLLPHRAAHLAAILLTLDDGRLYAAERARFKSSTKRLDSDGRDVDKMRYQQPLGPEHGSRPISDAGDGTGLLVSGERITSTVSPPQPHNSVESLPTNAVEPRGVYLPHPHLGEYENLDVATGNLMVATPLRVDEPSARLPPSAMEFFSPQTAIDPEHAALLKVTTAPALVSSPAPGSLPLNVPVEPPAGLALLRLSENRLLDWWRNRPPKRFRFVTRAMMAQAILAAMATARRSDSTASIQFDALELASQAADELLFGRSGCRRIAQLKRRLPSTPAIDTCPVELSSFELRLLVHDTDGGVALLNQVRVAGLEHTPTHPLLCCSVQILKHIRPLRLALNAHFCQRDPCLSCELSLLCHMLDLSTREGLRLPCRPANLVNAVRSLPEIWQCLFLTDHEKSKTDFHFALNIPGADGVNTDDAAPGEVPETLRHHHYSHHFGADATAGTDAYASMPSAASASAFANAAPAFFSFLFESLRKDLIGQETLLALSPSELEAHATPPGSPLVSARRRTTPTGSGLEAQSSIDGLNSTAGVVDFLFGYRSRVTASCKSKTVHTTTSTQTRFILDLSPTGVGQDTAPCAGPASFGYLVSEALKRRFTRRGFCRACNKSTKLAHFEKVVRLPPIILLGIRGIDFANDDEKLPDELYINGDGTGGVVAQRVDIDEPPRLSLPWRRYTLRAVVVSITDPKPPGSDGNSMENSNSFSHLVTHVRVGKAQLEGAKSFASTALRNALIDRTGAQVKAKQRNSATSAAEPVGASTAELETEGPSSRRGELRKVAGVAALQPSLTPIPLPNQCSAEKTDDESTWVTFNGFIVSRENRDVVLQAQQPWKRVILLMYASTDINLTENYLEPLQQSLPNDLETVEWEFDDNSVCEADETKMERPTGSPRASTNDSAAASCVASQEKFTKRNQKDPEIATEVAPAETGASLNADSWPSLDDDALVPVTSSQKRSSRKSATVLPVVSSAAPVAPISTTTTQETKAVTALIDKSQETECVGPKKADRLLGKKIQILTNRKREFENAAKKHIMDFGSVSRSTAAERHVAFKCPIPRSVILANVNLSRHPAAPLNPRSLFTPLSDEEAEKLEQGGMLLALDAEFVLMRRPGTSEELSFARLSVVRAEGPMEGVPCLDCHILAYEDPLDYLTQFSGLKPGDLQDIHCRYWLANRKLVYQKLRYLLDHRCTFIGHGLAKDFAIINLYVPHHQLIDTVQLFRLPGRRLLALRFLAYHLLSYEAQANPQGHDSVEDAVVALRLYRHWLRLKRAGDFPAALRYLYRIGARTGWSVITSVPVLGDFSTGILPLPSLIHNIANSSIPAGCPIESGVLPWESQSSEMSDDLLSDFYSRHTRTTESRNFAG